MGNDKGMVDNERRERGKKVQEKVSEKLEKSEEKQGGISGMATLCETLAMGMDASRRNQAYRFYYMPGGTNQENVAMRCAMRQVFGESVPDGTLLEIVPDEDLYTVTIRIAKVDDPPNYDISVLTALLDDDVLSDSVKDDVRRIIRNLIEQIDNRFTLNIGAEA